LTRGKANLHESYTEDFSIAYSPEIPLPSDRARPSPLLRQNFDQSWQRWKCRQQAEEREKALKMQEQFRTFHYVDGTGSEGELDDYDDDEDVSAIPKENMERVLRLLFGGATDYIVP